MREIPPLGLYIHLPWCVLKCPYCDFNSHEQRTLPEADYLRALMADIDWSLERDQKYTSKTHGWPSLSERPIETIFFGGGTPSLFSVESIHAILDGVGGRLNVSDGVEVTLEANPGTVEANKFTGFKSAGVNRLSIGVQSFAPDKLKALGRIHDDKQAHFAIEQAHEAGFAQAKGINIDLMFGLPNQTIEHALHDIQTAVALNPTHISHYQLTLEPGTAFFYRPPALPKDDDIWAMQTQCQRVLSEAGFGHYEVSAYAQTGKRCQHNINYWQYGDYLGIGAGAHEKLTYGEAIHRTSKVKQPERYMRHAGDKLVIDESFDVPKNERAFEFMMNALRLTDGFAPSVFVQRTGLGWEAVESTINSLVEKGLITATPNWVQPTEDGKRFLNVAMEAFL